MFSQPFSLLNTESKDIFRSTLVVVEILFGECLFSSNRIQKSEYFNVLINNGIHVCSKCQERRSLRIILLLLLPGSHHSSSLFICIPFHQSLQDKHFCCIKNSFLYNTKSIAQLAFSKIDNTAYFSSQFRVSNHNSLTLH